MACACLNYPSVKAGLMTLSSAATSAVLVGSMMLALHLADFSLQNEQPIHMVIIGITLLAGCWFPLWVPHKVEDYIDNL